MVKSIAAITPTENTLWNKSNRTIQGPINTFYSESRQRTIYILEAPKWCDWTSFKHPSYGIERHA